MNPPAWLRELQAGFGRLVHTRLDRSRGRIGVASDAYSEAVVGAIRAGGPLTPRARLAVYNRQCWFRFFTAFDGEFPLTARLRGHWSFNADVEDFLEANPPSSADIHEAAAGFEAFVLERFGDASAVGEAVRVDAAWRRAALAPQAVEWRPALDGRALASLLDERFVMHPGATLLRTTRAWVAARRALSTVGAEDPPFRPPPETTPEDWLVTAGAGGIHQRTLTVRQARFYRSLASASLGDALAELEEGAAASEQHTVAEDAMRWLGEGIASRLWIGTARDELPPEGATNCHGR